MDEPFPPPKRRGRPKGTRNKPDAPSKSRKRPMRDEREARALALFRELITLHGLKHSQIAEFVGLQTVIISKIAAGQMFVPETVLKAFGYKWVLRPLQAPDALLTKSDLALLEQKLQKTEEHLKALREQLGGSDDTESY